MFEKKPLDTPKKCMELRPWVQGSQYNIHEILDIDKSNVKCISTKKSAFLLFLYTNDLIVIEFPETNTKTMQKFQMLNTQGYIENPWIEVLLSPIIIHSHGICSPCPYKGQEGKHGYRKLGTCYTFFSI